MILRALTIVMISVLEASSVMAQEGASVIGAKQQLEILSSGSHETCLDTLGKTRKMYEGVRAKSVQSFPGFDLVAEAIRLNCEALRLKDESGRLELESKRLQTEARKLDLRWELETRSDPSRKNKYVERDRSQKIMRQDAVTAMEVTRTLLRVSGMLQAEALRILELADANARLLAAEDAKKVRTALDAESQNDILSRLLGLPPAQDNKKL